MRPSRSKRARRAVAALVLRLARGLGKCSVFLARLSQRIGPEESLYDLYFGEPDA